MPSSRLSMGYSVAIAMSVGCVACVVALDFDGFDTQAPSIAPEPGVPAGALRGACRADRTCNDGLVCAQGIVCLPPPVPVKMKQERRGRTGVLTQTEVAAACHLLHVCPQLSREASNALVACDPAPARGTVAVATCWTPPAASMRDSTAIARSETSASKDVSSDATAHRGVAPLSAAAST